MGHIDHCPFKNKHMALIVLVLATFVLNYSVFTMELAKKQTDLSVCGHSEWSPDSGGGTQWRSHRKTVDIPLVFIEVHCEDDNELSTENGSEPISSDLAASRMQLITIQEEDGIRFYLEMAESRNSTPEHKIILYIVTETELVACNSTGLTVFAEVLSNRNATLTPKSVSQGHMLLVGDCHNNDYIFYRCFRANISVKPNRCTKGNSEHHCTGKGVCLTNHTQTTYTCRCCPGYMGTFCEEQDGCFGNPCKNGGICIDISEGHQGNTFQCLCPYGYSGKTCEQITNKCDSQPCKNNGTCTGNQTVYTCSCAPGFTGVNCETNINDCASNPCIHGICVDGDDSFQCFCSPGYGGLNCQFEYKECDSSPCVNGGSCLEKVGAYLCSCGLGYTGNRCQVKVDLCQSNPCPDFKRCVDKGNNYSCECKVGFTGFDCETKFNACITNPCLNAGTCWSSSGTFFCACKAGFTGDRCQGIDFDVFHLEPIPTMIEEHSGPDMSIGVHLDHLHNIYIAAGTLASAFLIVLIIVGVCHCRVHKTYQRFAFRLPSNCPDEIDCKREGNRVKFSLDVDSCSPSQPSLDTLYEASGLDFADNMEAPLINISVKS